MDTLTPALTEERPLTAWMRRSRQRFPRAWCSWTPEEDERLKTLVAEQASPEEVQAALGRGPGGICARRLTLGLDPGPGPGTAPPPRLRKRRGGLPVPQMDWVPDWREHLPESRWVKETARLWGVSAAALNRAMDELDLEEWMVFVLRYGLAERCSYTAEAVAELLDLNQGSVRVLQGQAESVVRRALEEQGQPPVEMTLEQTLARCPPRRAKRAG